MRCHKSATGRKLILWTKWLFLWGILNWLCRERFGEISKHLREFKCFVGMLLNFFRVKRAAGPNKFPARLKAHR